MMNNVSPTVEIHSLNCTFEATSAATLEENRPSHQCSNCKMAFDTLPLLTEHKKIHGPAENLLKCQDCDRTFRSNYPLMLRQRMHSGARPFECEVLRCL